MPTLRPDRPVTAPAPIPLGPQPSAAFPSLALLIGLAGAAAISLAAPDAGILITIPALAVGAMATWRWPAAAVTLTFLLTGAMNALASRTPIQLSQIVDLTDYLLASLWIGVLGAYLLGRGKRRVWLWPALLAALLYIALTAVAALLTDPVSLGVLSFRSATWFMAAIVLVAIAPWPARTHAAIAKGVLLVALAVGAYSTYLWLVGASPGETAVARASKPEVPLAGLRFFGSFLSAFQLAAWIATTIPFCLAALLAWRGGPWRIVALAAIGFMALAMLASDVRTGLVATGIGVAITLGLFLRSPAFRRQRGVGVLVLAAIAVIGGASFAVTVASDPERLDRYARILTPGEDEAYSIRLERWGLALDEIRERPWGHGLGTVGHVSRFNDRGAVGPPILDNAYLKVGLEQGVAAMGLYFVALLALLIGLAHRTLRLRDRQRAMLAMGGAGALGAQMVMFYTGMHSEGSAVVGAWLLVGLGVAQVTVRDRRRAPHPTARVRT